MSYFVSKGHFDIKTDRGKIYDGIQFVLWISFEKGLIFFGRKSHFFDHKKNLSLHSQLNEIHECLTFDLSIPQNSERLNIAMLFLLNRVRRFSNRKDYSFSVWHLLSSDYFLLYRVFHSEMRETKDLVEHLKLNFHP